MNVSEAVQVGLLATLSHPPRTEASVIFTVDRVSQYKNAWESCCSRKRIKVKILIFLLDFIVCPGFS